MDSLDSTQAIDSLIGYLALLGLVLGVAILAYVLNGIFQMRALRAAGYHHPEAAWIPYWNTIALFELGGLRGAWAWAGLCWSVLLVGNLIPLVSSVANGIVAIAMIALQAWCAKTVQEASGLRSTGGIVLGALVPLAWMIWMGIRLPKSGFDAEQALAKGATFPVTIFRNLSDPSVRFGEHNTPSSLEE